MDSIVRAWKIIQAEKTSDLITQGIHFDSAMTDFPEESIQRTPISVHPQLHGLI